MSGVWKSKGDPVVNLMSRWGKVDVSATCSAGMRYWLANREVKK